MSKKQCYDCRRFTDDVKLVPRYVDRDTGDSWGAYLCFICKSNREAIEREDIRVRVGDDPDWRDENDE